MTRQFLDYTQLIGKRYGRLTVVLTGGRNKRREKLLHCRCDCGGEIETPYPRLKSGNTKSCGCLQPEKARISGLAKTTHGGYRSDTYKSYRLMLRRCYDINHISYKTHGGRGIKVADRWRGPDGFENFRVDMGERPDGMTLDRYPDNDGNYGPSNCRWATAREQARNMRSNRLITARGRTMVLKDWAIELGLSSTTILDRIKRGWTEEEAVTTPAHQKPVSKL